MQHKIITLTALFFVLFSLQGFSQTTEKSEHPLLDKYYPRAPKPDTNKVVTSQIKTYSETRPLPAPANISAQTTKPVVIDTTIPADTTTAAPVPNTTTVSSVTTSAAISTPDADINSITAPAKTPVVIKQDTVAAKVPVQVNPRPAPNPPYMDTRLGSSTPQYDTWKKNSNGAGSVTTSPK